MEFQKEIDTMVAMEEDLFEESAFAEYAENSSYEIFRFHLNRSQQERLIERCQTIHNFMKKEFGDINNFCGFNECKIEKEGVNKWKLKE